MTTSSNPQPAGARMTTSSNPQPVGASRTTERTPLRPFTSDGVSGGIGTSPRRPDGVPKVTGEFAYSSDLQADGMLWGSTLRSAHPHARIRSIDISGAVTMSGVQAVLTHEDVPGAPMYGLEIPDQPVLASDLVRFHGEAIAIVAADHPETAKRAAQAIVVEYEVLEPVTSVERALEEDSPKLHPGGNVTRHVKIRHGAGVDAAAQAEVIVRETYEVGMQDQAFLGPESGLAVPDDEGGIDLYIATQWLHVDQQQLAKVLDLPIGQVRLTLAGVGGAFGAREDLSMQAHCCMLALHTGKPVKMMYGREESFFGHVHRHPARMEYETGATRDGRLTHVTCRLLLDGGAYASSSTAVAANAACFALGPYLVPNAHVDSIVGYTNNPPCGAMRGFGAVQVAVAHEAQMDRLAFELGIDPVELRRINAMHEGAVMPTGQTITGPAPVRELLDAVVAMPLPDAQSTSGAAAADGTGFDLRRLPGGVANTTHGEGLKRGVGYAIGFKNICFAEGFDDFSTARVRLALDPDGEPFVSVHTAGAEVGQGLSTLQMQIARTEFDIEQIVLMPADTRVGSAGSTSASRQSYMTGGAVKVACEAVRTHVLHAAAASLAGMEVGAGGGAAKGGLHFRVPEVAGTAVSGDLYLAGGNVVSASHGVVASIAEVIGRTGPIEETREFHHKVTYPLDPETGQGDAHVQFAFAVHRAVVDVDVELGLVRVVQMDTAQDVGRILNPQSLEGQIEGGTSQGLGLALMEEIQVVDGVVKNPSFTDYLIPTILDMPPVNMTILECADPDAPYGLRGAGEPPSISSTPAIAAAVRDATGRPITRVPIRPEHIVGC